MFDKKVDVIIVDAGNTRIKTAVFSAGRIVQLSTFSLHQSSEFQMFIHSYEILPVFVSSVLAEEALLNFFGPNVSFECLSLKHKVPVKILYETPNTLGLDRLANAVAIQSLQNEGNKVAIDLGTCVKFDFVNANGEYVGGSISPGLRMRYESLHEFTGKLPLLETKISSKLIGTNSQDSIHSGVVNGMQAELDQFILRYSQQYQGLTFFVTGGDAKNFEFDSKNNIFAHENLTLYGLYYIYQQNA